VVWLRGIAFSVLLPGTLAVWLPILILAGRPAAGGLFHLGWLLTAAGTVLYSICLVQFLAAGGTPAIYFTRAFRWLVGKEPPSLVTGGVYRYSRNPMYLAVAAAVAGLSIVYRSLDLCFYTGVLWLCFHATVIWLEEPHLRRKTGPTYDEYRRRVPRWL
jgi:protein-S-isoprenylcysteine O-methyltransferase Ste14